MTKRSGGLAAVLVLAVALAACWSPTDPPDKDPKSDTDGDGKASAGLVEATVGGVGSSMVVEAELSNMAFVVPTRPHATFRRRDATPGELAFVAGCGTNARPPGIATRSPSSTSSIHPAV